MLGEKEAALTRLLSTLSFNQVSAQQFVRNTDCRAVRSHFCRVSCKALVFCNLRGWAEALAERLTQHGFPAAFTCGASYACAARRFCRLSRVRCLSVSSQGSLLQRRRMAVMDAVRHGRLHSMGLGVLTCCRAGARVPCSRARFDRP